MMMSFLPSCDDGNQEEEQLEGVDRSRQHVQQQLELLKAPYEP